MARVCLLVVLAAAAVEAQVTFDRLVDAGSEPQNWLTYSGGVRSHRYSRLDQITPGNVAQVRLQWVFQAQSLEKFEATPVVIDGVMYTVQPPNDLVALDAATGRVFWIYPYTPSADVRPCCGRVNRGVAVLGHSVFMATLDGHLLAVDARSGRLVWDSRIVGARPEAGYAFTVAPLVVKDMVIVGTAGGDFGVRGFLAAYDAETGAQRWRFHTVPGPGEPGHETWAGDSWRNGGAPIWVTGSYDPELDLMYWGTGNPGPDWNGDGRAGDNLYSDSVLALDPDTGELRWHFQFTPHDEFDFDATQVPVLVDLEWEGRPRKVMLWANRNGFFYVLDRETGEFLLGTPFTNLNWTSGLDEAGRPMDVRAPSPEGTLVAPTVGGGTNWYSPSYSPRTGLFYIPSWINTSAVFFKQPGPVEFVEGRSFVGAFPQSSVSSVFSGPVNQRPRDRGYGSIQAIDPHTGDQRWAFTMTDVTDSGILTTASDLLFVGGREGHFFALDARSGRPLWHASLGATVASGPMSYAIDGRQYVAVSAGHALFVFALPEPPA